MKRLKDKSDVSRARLGILPKNYTSSKRTIKLHSTRPRKNGYSRQLQQKSRRKESLWWIPELVCIWSASGTLTLLSWWQWGHREVRRRWWRSTVRCKQEKKRRYMSKNWTYSSQLCFLKKLPQIFFLGSSVRNMGILTTGQGSKTTSHQKGQENWLQCIKLCAIRRPWFILEFLCNAHTNYIVIFITGFRIWRKQIQWKSSTRKKWKHETRATGKPAAKTNRNRKHKKRTRRSTKRSIARLARLVAGFQRNFRWWTKSHRATEKPCASGSKTLPVLPMNYQWSREQKWNRVRISIVSTRTFQRTHIAISVWRRK